MNNDQMLRVISDIVQHLDAALWDKLFGDGADELNDAEQGELQSELLAVAHKHADLWFTPEGTGLKSLRERVAELEAAPSRFARHARGDNRRFHVRTYNGGKWQVYGLGLEHICECDRESMARMVAEALERAAEKGGNS
jgi:hypothetical protein